MDELRDNIRKPLTEWENIDKERVRILEVRLDTLKRYEGAIIEQETTGDLEKLIECFNDIYDHLWEEFDDRATVTANRLRPLMHKALDGAREYEKQQEELEAFRAKEETRKQEERDQKIADEAAAEAKQKAEEKAANEKKAAEEKAESEKQEIEDQRIAAEEAAAQAEQDKKDAEEKAATDAQKAADELKETEEKAEREKVAAATAAQESEEQAVQDEKDRVAAQEKADADAAIAREADKKHKGKINSEALADLIKESDIIMAGGAVDCYAKAVITAIAQGKVRHIRISY